MPHQPSKVILIITPSLDCTWGWGRYSVEVISRILRSHSQVRILTSAGKNQQNLPVLGYLKKPGNILDFFYNIRLVRKLAHEATIVHAFDGWPFAVYGMIACLGTPKKMFVNAVGTYSISPLDSRWKGAVLRLAYRRASKIFCISQFIERQLKSRIRNAPTAVVHLGLTHLPNLSKETHNRLAQRYPLRHSPLLLTVGALKSRKGQLDVVRALPFLLGEFPDLAYLMIGSTHDQAHASQILSVAKQLGVDSHIQIFDDIDDDESLAYFYQKCDVFLLPAKTVSGTYEGFGLVLLEAASFGKPVVGSYDSGTADAVWEGKNGELVQSGNAAEIAEKVRVILHGDRAAYRDASLEFVKGFTWEKTVQAYLEYYE